MNTLIRAAAAASLAAGPLMAENRIDMVRPDAPELAAHGDHVVGVRTMTFTDPGRVDVVNATAEGDRLFRRELAAQAIDMDGVTAAKDVSPDNLESVTETDVQERYAAEARRMADEHDPNDTI